jgi:hypothetical protein
MDEDFQDQLISIKNQLQIKDEQIIKLAEVYEKMSSQQNNLSILVNELTLKIIQMENKFHPTIIN